MNNLETMAFLGRCLAPGYDDTNGELAARIRSGAVDWKRLTLIATGHYLGPSLCSALKRREWWKLAPAETREILQAIHLLNRERNALHYEQLIAITCQLNSVDIEPLLLKGAICLLPGQFADAENRVLSDLDLLVPEDRAEDALHSIVNIGYAYDPEMYLGQFERHHHLPPLYHPTQGIRIEIHTYVTDASVKPILTAGAMWRSAFPVEFGGACGFVPDSHSRLLHNIVHARLDDRHHRDFKLEMRQLNEWVQLRESCEHEPDWARMRDQFDQHGETAVLETYCLAAQRFFGQPLPNGIAPSRAAVRAERIMCMALKGPVWSYLLSDVKNYPRRFLTPAAWVNKFRRTRHAWLKKNRPL